MFIATCEPLLIQVQRISSRAGDLPSDSSIGQISEIFCLGVQAKLVMLIKEGNGWNIDACFRNSE